MNALGILETTGFTSAMVALDAMEKAGAISVRQAELNDFLGVVIKIDGPVAEIEQAIAAGREAAERMLGRPVATVLPRPDSRAEPALTSKVEFNPLIQQNVVLELEAKRPAPASKKEQQQMAEAPMALGFIETQGFTAVFEAIDTACKAADVEVVCKEKLGGGYVTVVVRGDVAAVKAAVEAGRTKVEGLGKLIAAHVIPRPSPSVLRLLPKG